MVIGPIRIRGDLWTVHGPDGRLISLTSTEFRMLMLLARENGRVVSRERMSAEILGYPWNAQNRSVDQIVFNLRRKLPRGGDGALLITAVRAKGYRMRPPEAAPVDPEAVAREEVREAAVQQALVAIRSEAHVSVREALQAAICAMLERSGLDPAVCAGMLQEQARSWLQRAAGTNGSC